MTKNWWFFTKFQMNSKIHFLKVQWLLRHHDNPPPRTGKTKTAEDLVDRHLPELLFYMEELRALVRKYSQVLQRYFVQYLSGYDAVSLNQLLQPLQTLSEEESVILSSLCNTIGGLSIKQVEENELFDFRGLRLDWCRLQAYTSVAKSQLVLADHRELATLLNTIAFHMKMVDALDDMLTDTSDLSIFWWFQFLTSFQKLVIFDQILKLDIFNQFLQFQFGNFDHFHNLVIFNQFFSPISKNLWFLTKFWNWRF